MKRNVLFLVTIFCVAFVAAQNPLPKWEKGYLDIHHINTGRGNCTRSEEHTSELQSR